jgi:hypothetical protein
MNIRRWLPRRGPLIVAALAMTGAAVIAAVPASAATNVFCTLSSPYPRVNASGTLVSADAYVTCTGGAASAINLALDLARNGVIVDSVLTGGTFGASAVTVASCVPGNYVATAAATIWYPIGNIPGSSSQRWQSPSVYISCAPPPPPPTTPVVANPGNQSMALYESAAVQLTATGGTPPYTWSAAPLPTGLSVNRSTGLISGTVTRLGTYAVTATAVDAAGRSGSVRFSWAVRLDACLLC